MKYPDCNLPPTVSAEKGRRSWGGTQGRGRESHASELKNVWQNGAVEARMESKTALLKALAPICQQRRQEIQFTT